MFSIGDLSAATGVKVPTIRYYEQMGLMSAPSRSEGGQRRYTTAERDRLGFIRHARDLGLSLDAIRELIALSEEPERSCADVDAIARRHLDQIRARIAQLQRLEGELGRIVQSCSRGTVGDCSVLQALGDHALCETEHR
ncbi:MAG: helix-turn-helix domain-containing protein [Marivibrio sp.]|uniref:MerR family transcriptional regulator n=1 Tax=Marivibrio sp. TaxID=2039719 RepID=UPI0032EECFB0